VSDPARPISDRALILLLAAITAAGPVALNIYLPVLPQVQAEFGVSVAAANTTVSAPLVAFAFGILFYGPFSDHVGRRPAILIGLLVYLVGTALAMLAPSIALVTAGRVIQALGTAGGLTVARAIISDRFPRDRMAQTLANLTMVLVIANALAPAVGGLLGKWLEWRAVFGVLLIAGVLVALYSWRALPETRDTGATPSTVAQLGVAASRLVRLPAFLVLTLQGGVIFATFLVFIALAPYVMVQALHRDVTEYGFWYLLIAIGYFIGNWSVTRLGTGRTPEQMVRIGLGLQAAGAVLGLVLVLLGWWHPATLFAPWAVIAYGQGLALPNITAEAVQLSPQFSGVASSLLGFSQQLMAAASIQMMAVFATDTPLPTVVFVAAASVLAFISLSLVRRPVAA